MRTTLNLPGDLVRKAQKAARARTKTETIIQGLRALLRQEQAEGLLALQGKLPLRIDLSKSRARA
jgi:hypothetical protein